MNILLIDGHRLFSDALRYRLLAQPDIGKVYISDELCFSLEPYLSGIDIVVCDMNEPRMSGLQVIDTLRRKLHQARIAVISGISNLPTIKQALTAGADAFISKNADTKELIEAIYTIRSGKRFISQSLRMHFLNAAYKEEHHELSLTNKEKNIVRELCAGHTIKDIAREMGVSTHTIQYHQRNILRKLNLSRTADLIVYAVRNGIYSGSSGS
ncbi:LuxR C-terminal-related transcriptional regulator [Taibaiella koreensis]|uniref:LuxR C-terminal-related transcriptional regulator n=1 Tax=Taibaiella koreensis TaxID=1268548 RepID=UPI000E59B422|nr:response regulator transcription factor [Taibaiella koreensis]